MREIKFRCWNKEKQKMIYNVDLYSSGMATDATDDNPYEFDQKTLGQYTGLKDKKDKEIFESDIVHVTGPEINTKGIVEYHESYYRIRYQFGADSFVGHQDRSYEVIGNVYQNLELVKQP